MKGMAEDSHKTDYFLKTCIRHYVFKTKLTGFYHLSIMLFVSNHEIEGEGRLMCLEFFRITIVIRGLQATDSFIYADSFSTNKTKPN